MNQMPNSLIHILKEFKPKNVINLAQESLNKNIKYDLVILDESKNQHDQILDSFDSVHSTGFLYGINWNKDMVGIKAAAAEIGAMIADNLEPNVWIIRKK